MTVSASFDFSRMLAKMDAIKAAAKTGTRVAAQAGAQVLYEEVEAKAPVGSEAEHYFYGRAAARAAKGDKRAKAYLFTRGTLKKAVYQFFNARLSTDGRAVYSISVNRTKAPYFSMVENGTSRAAAHPFLRPAYDSARGRALRASKSAMARHIKKVIGQ